ncbi:hypothetical protein [Cesiribacter sp. SM1]|uniref:hypothetical protein n=1 Tax=Cesiribacter sp. SM1 TaxID=2861196 RepID=UPI001CD2FA5D|nr:hypothetical protein [Cesiribacter sp. SM1]
MKQRNNHLFLCTLALMVCVAVLPAPAQTLLFKGNFAVPKAVATAQDVQGNLYLATPQGQVIQYNGKGQKGVSFSPDEMLSISSLEALPGLQLLLFDRTNQQLLWVDRFLTQSGSYRLSADNNAGFIDAVAAAEGNGIWLVDGSRQRLLKQQFPGGELAVSIPLNLVAGSSQMKFNYLREHKGKIYLYSPTTGFLVFDAMGNYELTHDLPGLHSLSLDEDRFYFLQRNQLGYLDLKTHEVVRIPLVEASPEHLLVKGRDIWVFNKGEVYHYLMMPPAAAAQQK